MIFELQEKIKGASHCFSNGYTVINVSSYPLKFIDGDEKIIINPTGIVIEIDEIDGFRPTEEGSKILRTIQRMFPKGLIIDHIFEHEKWFNIENIFENFAFDCL